MLEFFYALIISPLRAAMELVLTQAYALTDSYGWSIVIMSICVNIALIPVYHLAESWQEDERRLQTLMQGKLLEIKQVYAGRERDMFTRAIYRMHGYHPMLALRTSLGLLIQIPFFFAAYNLLHANPALQGASFFFISNLGLPDALITISAHSVNLLPFVMTAVNLLSASVYSSRLNRRDKIQLYVLAALFLVLLYTASAGLLLYWTCNNIFSFFKNIVYKRYVYPDSGHELPGWLVKLTRALSLLPNTGGALLARLPKWAGLVFVVGAIALLAGMDNLWRNKYYLNIAFICFALALCAACIQWVRVKRFGNEIKKQLLVPTLIFALFAGTIIIASFGDAKIGTPLRALYSSLYAYSITALIFWLLNLRLPSTGLARLSAFCATRLNATLSGRLYRCSVLIAGLLIFFYQPASLFYSDPDFFTAPLPSILGDMGFRIMLFAGICLFIYRRCGNGVKALVSVVAAWFSLCALLYAFVVVFDYGEMNGPFLQHIYKFTFALATISDLLVFSAAALILTFMLRRHKGRAFAGIMQSLCLVVLCGGIVQFSLAEPRLLYDETAKREVLPPYTERFFGFSENGKNILVLLLDAFTGDHMDKIIAEDPELAANFTGFTWYTDHISAGTNTIYSIAAYMGGEHYTPVEINKRAQKPLIEEINEAYSVMPNLLLPQGYDVTLADLESFDKKLLGKYCPRVSDILITRQADKDFVNRWLNKYEYAVLKKPGQSSFMSVFGFFKSSPSFMRKHIYRGGSWLHTYAILTGNSTGGYAILDTMSDLLQATPKQNTFKAIHSNFTHAPWDLTEDCGPANSGYVADVKTTTNEQGYISEHYWAERCAIRGVAKVIQSLKAKNIYGNTQIIVLSDHTSGDSIKFKNMQGPYVPALKGSNALFMVKNFNAEHPLIIDSHTLTATGDVLAFICKAGNFCGNINYYDPLAKHAEPRVRTTSSGATNLKRHNTNSYIMETHKVIGPLDNMDNWSKYTE